MRKSELDRSSWKVWTTHSQFAHKISYWTFPANLRWGCTSFSVVMWYRLLDMGFEKDVQSILSLLDSRRSSSSNASASIGSRQNILLSATLNEHVNQLAELSLREPVTVGLHSRENAGRSENLETSGEERHHKEEEDQDEEEGTSEGQTDYNIPSQLNQRFYKGMLFTGWCIARFREELKVLIHFLRLCVTIVRMQVFRRDMLGKHFSNWL